MKNKNVLLQVFSNNMYLFAFCFKTAPCFLVCFILEAIRNEVVMFLEYTLVFNYVLECAELNKPFISVLTVIILLFIFVCIGLLFNGVIFQKLKLKYMPEIKKNLKQTLYEKSVKIKYSKIDNPKYYDDITFVISQADNQIERLFDTINKVISCIVAFLTAGAFYIYNDALSLIFIIFTFVFSYLFNKVIAQLNFKIKLEKNTHEKKKNYINRFFYMSDYAKDIRINPNMAEFYLEQYVLSNQMVYQIEKKYCIKKWLITFINKYILNSFLYDCIYILYLVFKAAVLHVLTYSNIVVLFTSSSRLKYKLRLFTEILPFAEETSLYVDKIKAFMNYEETEYPNSVEISNKSNLFDNSISIKNLSYNYDNSEFGLKDIDMCIYKGQKVAIVGNNGSGKTTLIKILTGLYDEYSGNIFFDNNNFRDIDKKSYNAKIGVLFQDFNLYAASLLENVGMDIEENCNATAVVASLHKSSMDMDKFADKIYYDVTKEFSNDGLNLSGGEQQKVAIARTFYGNYDLIILDEPSSALDPISEYRLNTLIKEGLQDKTVIYITHRLSTTRFADCIFVLDDGKIIESGTHEQLLSLSGKYFEMWNSQASLYKMEEFCEKNFTY